MAPPGSSCEPPNNGADDAISTSFTMFIKPPPPPSSVETWSESDRLPTDVGEFDDDDVPPFPVSSPESLLDDDLEVLVVMLLLMLPLLF